MTVATPTTRRSSHRGEGGDEPRTAHCLARAPRHGSCASCTFRPAVPYSRGEASTSSIFRPSTKDSSDRTFRVLLHVARSLLQGTPHRGRSASPARPRDLHSAGEWRRRNLSLIH